MDGPWHFTSNTLEPLGPTLHKRRQLARAGWQVVAIPFHEWIQLPGRAAKQVRVWGSESRSVAYLPSTNFVLSFGSASNAACRRRHVNITRIRFIDFKKCKAGGMLAPAAEEQPLMRCTAEPHGYTRHRVTNWPLLQQRPDQISESDTSRLLRQAYIARRLEAAGRTVDSLAAAYVWQQEEQQQEPEEAPRRAPLRSSPAYIRAAGSAVAGQPADGSPAGATAAAQPAAGSPASGQERRPGASPAAGEAAPPPDASRAADQALRPGASPAAGAIGAVASNADARQQAAPLGSAASGAAAAAGAGAAAGTAQAVGLGPRPPDTSRARTPGPEAAASAAALDAVAQPQAPPVRTSKQQAAVSQRALRLAVRKV